MHYNTLLKLAGINDENEIMAELGLSDDTIVNSEFSAALKEMQEEDRKKAMKNAAKEVIDLLKQGFRCCVQCRHYQQIILRKTFCFRPQEIAFHIQFI